MRLSRSPFQAARVLVAGLLFTVACQPGGQGCGPAAPPLALSQPAHGDADVSPGSWIVLDFAQPIFRVHQVGFRLACAGEVGEHPLSIHLLHRRRVVLNPAGQLPAGDVCALSWNAEDGNGLVQFSTAAAGPAVRVIHDRSDPGLTGPYPDDFYLTEDPETVTGRRLDYPVPDRTLDVQTVFEKLLVDANQLDGFSPIGHMVVEVSEPLDPESLPRTPAESLEPLASVALLNLTPWSRSFGRRVPIRVDVRNGDLTSRGLESHSLLIFPSIPLEPRGRYGLVLTRRIHTETGQPLAPSGFFEQVLEAPVAGEDPAVTRSRELVQGLLGVVGFLGRPPIPREDIAYAARISIRSTRSIQDDLQVMKRQVLAQPPALLDIDLDDPDAVVPVGNEHVAALVRGTWDAPDWRTGTMVARDEEGLPVQTGSRPVCFRLALPAAALDGPVPVVLYQHGNPGQSETEVLGQAVRFLAQAGYAVIGFTDILNREVAPPAASPGTSCIEYESPESDSETRITAQVFGIVLDLLNSGQLADHWNETLAEQLAFVRAIQGLGELDLLPLGAPDGVPDLDPDRLLYMGVSEGANNGQAFVAYAPEVRAAALIVGGSRLVETLLHQQSATFLETLPLIFPNFAPADIWVATALFQADFDRQDKQNHARFAYRRPARVPLFCDDLASCLEPDWCEQPGHCTRRKPSVLLTEGLDDSLVPNHATDSAAWQLGPMPHLEPVQRAVPFLRTAHGAVSGNIDPETTAAFYQFVPDGVPGIPITPGCMSPPLSQTSSEEGHYCAQSAVEARAQRLIFFGTALDPLRAAPTIVDPLPFYPEGTPLFPLPDPLP